MQTNHVLIFISNQLIKPHKIFSIFYYNSFAISLTFPLACGSRLNLFYNSPIYGN